MEHENRTKAYWSKLQPDLCNGFGLLAGHRALCPGTGLGQAIACVFHMQVIPGRLAQDCRWPFMIYRAGRRRAGWEPYGLTVVMPFVFPEPNATASRERTVVCVAEPLATIGASVFNNKLSPPGKRSGVNNAWLNSPGSTERPLSTLERDDYSNTSIKTHTEYWKQYRKSPDWSCLSFANCRAWSISTRRH